MELGAGSGIDKHWWRGVRGGIRYTLTSHLFRAALFLHALTLTGEASEELLFALTAHFFEATCFLY